MIDKIGHYSLTNPATVYDEEALTALELAARTAGKVNEVVESQNKLVKETPARIENEVQKHLDSGKFDEQIDEYAGNLHERIDNTFGSLPEGSTTLDAEVIDLRMYADGTAGMSAGTTTRNNLRFLNEMINPDTLKIFPEWTYEGTSNKQLLSGIISALKPCTITVPSGYQASVYRANITAGGGSSEIVKETTTTMPTPYIDQNGDEIGIKIRFKRVDGGIIAPLEVNALRFTFYEGESNEIFDRLGQVAIVSESYAEYSRVRLTTPTPTKYAKPYRITCKNGMQVNVDRYTTDALGADNFLGSSGWVESLTVTTADYVTVSFRNTAANMVVATDLENVTVEAVEFPDALKNYTLEKAGFYNSLAPREPSGAYNANVYTTDMLVTDKALVIESVDPSYWFSIRYYTDNGNGTYTNQMDSGWISTRHTIPAGIAFNMSFRHSEYNHFELEKVGLFYKITEPEFDPALTDILATVKNRTVDNNGALIPSYGRLATDEVTLDKPLYLYHDEGKEMMTYHLYENGIKVYDHGWSSVLVVPAGVPVVLYFKSETNTAHVFDLVHIRKRPKFMPARHESIKSIAHRGLSAHAPENTMSAFKAAKAHGYKYVECDVYPCSDNILVLLHDETIDRTSNGSGNITEMGYASASIYDFGSWFNAGFAGEEIPTLNTFMAWCKKNSIHPYLEIKTGLTDNQLALLKYAIQLNGMENECTVIGSEYVLEQARSMFPNIRVGWVVNDFESSDADYIKATFGENVFIDCYSNNVTESHARWCWQNNLPLEVWTPDTEAAVKALPPYVSGVTTNKLMVNEIYEKELS